MVQHRGHPAGIVLMLISIGSFAVMHAAMKSLTPHYPPLQLAALRGLVSLPLIAGWVLSRGEWARVLRVRWPLQLLRGSFVLLTGVMAVVALKVLPLSDAYSMSFAAPLIITLLSIPVLGELVDLRRWLAVIAGFVGVLVVLRPSSSDMLTLGGLAMLVSALGYALAMLTTRILARTDATTSTVFWTLVVVSAGAGLLAAPGWLPIRAEHWPRLVAVGVLGTFGQYAITEALRRAPASVIAPFEYTALIWGLVIDWWLWGTLPSAATALGTVLIVGSGLYLIRRERRSSGDRAVGEALAVRGGGSE